MTSLSIGGAKGGGGSIPRAPIVQPDTLRSVSIVEVVEAICEGEIEGFATADPLQSIYLDDTPLKTGDTNNFEGIAVDYRLGTQDQTYIPGTVDDTSAALVTVGADVTHDTPVIRSITDTTTDAVRLTVRFASLFKVDAETGDRVGVSVTLQVDVRLDGGAWLPADLAGRQVIRGKTESSYERSYHVNLKAFGEATTYDVRVSRVSADPGDNVFSEFTWDSYAKLSYAKLRYPHTVVVRTTFDARHFDSVPTRGYLMKGLKVKVPGPSVYNPVARVYTGSDWDGNFVTSWTRNPAWILYDLVTDPRYGLGELINPVYQDKWTLFQIAKRCDALVPDGFGGQEPRYSLDVYIQSAESAKNVVKDIASSFDAMAYWGNSAILTTQDAPKAASELYVPGNVVKGQFTYVGTARQTRYTVCLVQWNDPSDKYRIATEYVEDPEAIDRYGYRELSVAAIGCTSRAQAHRHGKRILLTGRLEPEIVNFSVGLEGLKSQIGNICRVADPLRSEGKRFGGRVKSGSTVNYVNLDAVPDLSGASAWRVAVIDSAGVVIDRLVSGTVLVDDYLRINVSPAFSSAPEPDLAWVIYDPAQAQQTWRIISITENENPDDGFYSITATRYDGAKYALIDSTTDLPPLPENPFINNSVVPPSGLVVQEGVYTALEGLRRYIDLSWSASTDRFLRGYRLVYRHNGAILFDDEIDGQSYRIAGPHVGDWEFTLSAVTTIGKYSTSITVQYALGGLYDISFVRITGLGTPNGPLTFIGRDPEFIWSHDAADVLGSAVAYGDGDGGQSPWFRDFQIDIYNPTTLVRTDFVTESKYRYAFDKSIFDGGPYRTVKVVVRARDYFGRYSQSATVTVSNPSPSAITTVNIFTGWQSLIIHYLRPTDNDWMGAIIFLGTSSDFTPAESNRVYIGSDTVVTIPNLLDSTHYYIRIASYDAFGGANEYTLSGVVYMATIDPLPELTPAEVKDKLQAELNNPETNALVWEADLFAMRFQGTDKTPFILGQVDNNPALLLDSDVYVTGAVSADQIVGGRVAATENIIIGDGRAVINGNGSMIVYNNADTVSNRDFAILTGGTLSFQRYRGGAYHDYKSVRRVEYGAANSGDTVTLPGYWDSQPRLIVSPASLRSYDARYPSASQTWVVRADNLNQNPAGSGIWEFDAVAELAFTSSAGVQTVASDSGLTASDGWMSGESVLPAGVSHVTVLVKFSSIRGDGVSTRGFYYRSVWYNIQGWNGSIWVDLTADVRNITSAEHGNQVSANAYATIPSGVSKIRLAMGAFDTNGSKYSLGGDDYNYAQNSAAVSPTTNNSIGVSTTNTTHNATAHMPAYSAPFGWDIYAIKYLADWSASASNGLNSFKLFANGVQVVSGQVGASVGIYSRNGSYDSGNIATTSYNPDYWSIRVTTGANPGLKSMTVTPTSSTIYLRQMILNSSTPRNQFTFQDYAWDIAASSAIAQGSLNWIAVGD